MKHPNAVIIKSSSGGGHPATRSSNSDEKAKIIEENLKVLEAETKVKREFNNLSFASKVVAVGGGLVSLVIQLIKSVIISTTRVTWCPAAMAVGCEKCPMFKICPGKAILGNMADKGPPDKQFEGYINKAP